MEKMLEVIEYLQKKIDKLPLNQKDVFRKEFRENMDYLRLCFKYLLFDIEASTRENQKLRRQLTKGEMEDESYLED